MKNIFIGIKEKLKDIVSFGKAEKLKPVRPVTPKPEPIPVPKDPTITDK